MMHILMVQYVTAVAETGNISRAAEKLFISQPALSQSIRRLEAELQIQLFQKKNGRFVPTAAGEIVIDKGMKILELHREMLNEISNINNLRGGTLNIGVAPYYHKIYLSRCLSEFQARYPGVEVAVQESFTQNTISGILSGELDLGLVVTPPDLDTVETCIEAFDEEVLLAVPPGFQINSQYRVDDGNYPEVDLSDFKEMSFISYRPGRNMTKLMNDKCEQAGFVPHIVFKCSNAESLNAMIASGMGVGFVPGSIAEICPPNQRAVYYRLRGDRIMRRFMFVCKKKSKKSLVQQHFLRLVEERSERA